MPSTHRLTPLPIDTTPALKPHFDFFLGTLGFTPNSVLIMQRRPKLVQAFAQLNAAVMDPQGEVDLGLKRLIAHVASKAAGCLYCQAHTLLGAQNFGVTEEKLADVWHYATSPHYNAAERAALDFALAAAAQPNAVSDDLFAATRAHWSEDQMVEILGVVAMFGFLNRWNDSLATPLEAAPQAVAEKALGDKWHAGKHA